MLGTKPTIVLSSDIAVKELLDKRGNIYSDRPALFVSQIIASGGHRLVIMVSAAVLSLAIVWNFPYEEFRLLTQIRNMEIHGERSISWYITS